LFIISPKELTYFLSTVDDRKTINKYVDLLDRSIAKYKDHVVVDTDNDYTDYLSLNKSDPINNVLPV
jgi:hypothetical protein